MQGLHEFIPTQRKIRYINSLLKAGFDTIDFGSFVSAAVIPQMIDTAEVLEGLNIDHESSNLLAIIANYKGAEVAMQYDEINYLGFPFSISETFQKRNTNSGMAESLNTVKKIQDRCLAGGKELVIYISMGFGNPYGDPWGPEIAEKWVEEMSVIGIRIISLSDTIGIAKPESVSYLFSKLIPAFEHIEFGAHLHTTPDTWKEKVEAAWNSGCRRFDGAIKGFGGCPMAEDKLTGNMPTEKMVSWFNQNKIESGIHTEPFQKAMLLASELFLG